MKSDDQILSSLDPWMLWQCCGVLLGEEENFEIFAEEGRDIFSIGDELSALTGKRPKFTFLEKADFQRRYEELLSGHIGLKNHLHAENRRSGDRLLDSVNHWLRHGIRRCASDIHFESDDCSFAVRMRIDGTLRTVHQFPAEEKTEVSACLKAMANLDIVEHFRPQDGRLHCSVDGRSVECRISILPTKNGESIVLRILDKQRLFPRLDDLSMAADLLVAVRRIMAMESGLFMVIGPTGSGKTTSMYAALQEMNCSDGKLLTVEDPIEYELDGILQVSVDFCSGRTFSSALRAFLRHDPDKILVGEIRDGETAQTALQAALTGHLVLTTLHTATADEAIRRLQQMAVDPFLLGCCLRGILSQRLLRLNCPHCKEIARVEDQWEEIFASVPPECRMRSRGCEKCENQGYVGRQALFELQLFDNFKGDFFVEGKVDFSFRSPTLGEQAMDLVRGGLLSPEEFLRQIPWEN
jgi:type II secretory ATPase GspE/PulE/Tfp pilus assembly ATPase PilB-like protein